ncbi:hypothetical protein M5689_023236 [Euphorbia peplus]|nr:hypothetical protein M5689_023236 [Euphorbia peplus]
MESSLLLMSITGILREAFKIFKKNGKIFSFIAIFTLSINSIQYFTNFYSIKPLITDLIMEANDLSFNNNNTTLETNPESRKILAHMTKDLKIFVGLELIYFTIDTFSFLFTTTATILTAALIYGGKQNELSFTNVVARTFKSWFRVLRTWFVTFMFGVLLFFVFGFLICVAAFIFTDHRQLVLATITIGVLTMILYTYLSVKWNLAIVISAVEKTKGIEAISKAGEILKGMKMKGFLMNLLVSVLGVVLSSGIQMIFPAKSGSSVVLFKGAVGVYVRSLVNMYYFAVFTVIYYMCKKNHGERVELEESCSNGYTMVSSTFIAPNVDDQLP